MPVPFRLTQRYLILVIFGLFFLNVLLIAHVLNLQLISQHLFGDVRWHAGVRSSQFGSSTEAKDGSSLESLADFDCNISDPMAISALSRMQTEECREAAKKVICGTAIPDSLPNTCPKYDEAVRGQSVGCFSDKISSRILTGHLYRFKKDNTPPRCVNACLRAGYKLAGVEYSEECFCGDELKDASVLPSSACHRYLCPSDSHSYCGGHEAVAVYTTGIKDKTIQTVKYMEPDDFSSYNVRILFLLQLNGRNIRQITRMLRIIYKPKHFYIIHVDSRQTFMFREMQKLKRRLQEAGLLNMHLMENRYATIWAGSSLLSMVLDAIKEAVHNKNWTEWDFLFNLSESDFPVLSLPELEFHLARNAGKNFLSSHGYDTARFIKKQGLDFIFMQCENRMWRLGKRSKFPSRVRIDGGSDWISLSRDFALFSISNDTLAAGLRDIFANILLPVESFFHTLALNSAFCDRVVKGNLRLTNWLRRQGCRCAMLKKVVDWCGCSPLIFKQTDIPRFSVKVAKKKPVFFARKFDSLISQGAIAAAERQALMDRPEMLHAEHPSFTKTWVNLYTSSIDNSGLLRAWARALFLNAAKSRFGVNLCSFEDLLSLYAYKEDDESEISVIVEVSSTCGSSDRAVIQLLVASHNERQIAVESIVDGYRLMDIQIGSDPDLKEEIFRNFAGVLSDDDDIYVYLRWLRIETASTTVHSNYSSPVVDVTWKDPNGRELFATMPSYDSMNGAQYGQLPANETVPGEWTVSVWAKSSNASTLSSKIASSSFFIFSSDGSSVPLNFISKYFKVSDICSDQIENLSICEQTSWSHSSPDPKSHFPY